jgi:uncharacterized protein YggT (Ycf19 family)
MIYLNIFDCLLSDLINVSIIKLSNIDNDFEVYSSLQSILVFLLNFISYTYILVKFYKVLCYAKLTCEWFPILNPYEWPFSFFQTMTIPYFRFWSNVLPTLKFQKSSVEISGIIALEALNAIIYFCVRAANALVINIEYIEKFLQNLP